MNDCSIQSDNRLSWVWLPAPRANPTVTPALLLWALDDAQSPDASAGLFFNLAFIVCPHPNIKSDRYHTE